MHIIGLQYAPKWLDKAGSHRVVERLLAETNPEPGALVVLPEMCDTGWALELDAATTGDTLEWARTLASTHNVSICIGYAERTKDGRGFNCSAIAHADGSIGPIYRKVHPFSFGAEGDVYSAGDELVIDQVRSTPVGLSICYDLRFPEFFRHLALAGAEVLTVIASWPVERAAHWRALAIARAIENQAYVVAVNRVGSDPSFTYGGGSLIISPLGEVLAEGGGDEAVISAPFDRTTLSEWRRRFPALKDAHRGLLGAPVIRTGVDG